MEPEPYEYTKLYNLPAHLCYACKRGDIDACLAGLGIAAPFDRVVMAKGVYPESALKRAFLKEAFGIGSAEWRFVPRQYRGVDGRGISRTLWVNVVPKEFAAQVRARMRVEGLKMLFEWFHKANNLPETWQTHSHKAELVYHKNGDRVELEEEG